MAEEKDDVLRETAPGAMLEAAKAAMGRAGETMLKDAPRDLTRYSLKAIPWGPGIVYDVAHVLTAKDKLRAGLGVAGGILGGIAGEGAGPLGAAVGYSAGEAGADWLYDHRTDIGDWMKRRAAQAGHGFDRGMPPYSSTLR